GPDDSARRLLEVVRDDRLAPRLRCDAAAARRARRAADGQLELLHGVVRAARRDRRAPGRPDAGHRHGGGVQAAPRPARGRPQRSTRRQVRAAARRILRVPEHHRHRPALRRGGRAPPERGRRGRAVRRGVRRPRRRLSPVLVRELGSEPAKGARSDAPGVRELREEVTRRTTAADVVVDGLRRAGTPRVIGVARERADLPILDAARAAGLPVVLAAGETGACAIAAVTGDLVDAPGAVVIGEKATVSAATLGMLGGAPVILITSSHPSALPAPLVTTARAKGALPDPHPLMLGVLGITGVEERLLGRADLVVAIGLDALEPVQPCWSAAPVIVFGPAAASDGRGPAVQVLG